MRKELIEQVAITLELGGADLSTAAKEVIVSELKAYPELDVARALQRCRRELKGRVSFADIHSRIPGARPSANEAWGTLPRSERRSVVWTTETSEAFGEIREILDRGDEVGARLAFREIYERKVRESEDSGIPVKWEFSGGDDQGERIRVLQTAVAQNKIPKELALKIEPTAIVGNESIKNTLTGDTKTAKALPRPRHTSGSRATLPCSLPHGKRGTIQDIPPEIYALYDKKNIRPYLQGLAEYLGCEHVLGWFCEAMGVEEKG